MKINYYDIKKGMEILVIESEFKGLKGIITDIRRGKEKDTENPSELDIYVDLEDNGEFKLQRLDQLIFGEEQLAYYINSDTELPIIIDGRLICIDCLNPIDKITETKTLFNAWFFNKENGCYEQQPTLGDTLHKRCSICSARINVNGGFLDGKL